METMTKEQVLKTYFGYDSFRPGQEMLVDGILAGRDTLGIMPTGAGKSLCYQIPALLMDGVTIVVSPLISLMKDQVMTLNQAGIHAAYLNSSLTAGQYQTALRNMVKGQYKIVYVAPERLMTQSFLGAARQIHIAMVSVDEAHCISQWGQDFRPDYLKIRDFVDALGNCPPAGESAFAGASGGETTDGRFEAAAERSGADSSGRFERHFPGADDGVTQGRRPVISAFTATATKQVREDILAQLGLRDPVCLTTGFDRPNLKFTVSRPSDKRQAMLDYVRRHDGECGIIYCLTRKTVEEVRDVLYTEGYSVTRYHAGLSDAERKENQEDFIYDRKQIMVATNAFGMGIDKSNVRYVLHYNMPKNIESYYQEAGRAGRDGLPSECVLLYGGQDVATNQFLIDRMDGAQEMDDETASLIRQRERERLKKMTYYCFTSDCLRAYILQYFGERAEASCGNCSNCLTQFEEQDISAAAGNIVGCVKSAVRSYGVTVILDTVHGSRSAKILRSKMDENPYYGSCEKESMSRLREILNFLLVHGYLYVTDTDYPVLELGPRADEALAGAPILMKTLQEQDRKSVGEKRKRKKPVDENGEIDADLFDALRSLRMEIARREKVPPYIIFSDKTLQQMCRLRPQTKEEMLDVSGVGAVKYARYGEQFLEALQHRKDGQTQKAPEKNTE